MFWWYALRPVEFVTSCGDPFWVSACDAVMVESSSGFTTQRPKASHSAYAASLGTRRQELLHRMIMRPGEGLVVDHIDGNAMNCVRQNMRCCTHQQNMWNRRRGINNASGFVGVSRARRDTRWRACIQHNNKTIHLGMHTTPEDAARAYDAKCLELSGEFAVLNFPQ